MATYYKHETAIVDDGAVIGDDSRVWHFAHGKMFL
jgi:UDP-2-acetamido-3-amino-2,3-dideoxy-glucuronate N-acetyltransferase